MVQKSWKSIQHQYQPNGDMIIPWLPWVHVIIIHPIIVEGPKWWNEPTARQ